MDNIALPWQKMSKLLMILEVVNADKHIPSPLKSFEQLELERLNQIINFLS